MILTTAQTSSRPLVVTRYVCGYTARASAAGDGCRIQLLPIEAYVLDTGDPRTRRVIIYDHFHRPTIYPLPAGYVPVGIAR